jgi:hypothetical protein
LLTSSEAAQYLKIERRTFGTRVCMGVRHGRARAWKSYSTEFTCSKVFHSHAHRVCRGMYGA